MTPFWQPVQGDGLAQGDLLPNCPVPMFPATFGGTAGITPFGWSWGT
jgi:hypothetical protein